MLRKGEILHIIRSRVEKFRNLPRTRCVMPLPGILGVGILRDIITLSLNMSRDMDLTPVMTIHIHPVKVFDRKRIVFCPGKFPDSVQAVLKSTLPHFTGFPALIKAMIRMCIQTVLFKNPGIGNDRIVKFRHVFSLQSKNRPASDHRPLLSIASTCWRFSYKTHPPT